MMTSEFIYDRLPRPPLGVVAVIVLGGVDTRRHTAYVIA